MKKIKPVLCCRVFIQLDDNEDYHVRRISIRAGYATSPTNWVKTCNVTLQCQADKSEDFNRFYGLHVDTRIDLTGSSSIYIAETLDLIAKINKGIEKYEAPRAVMYESNGEKKATIAHCDFDRLLQLFKAWGAEILSLKRENCDYFKKDEFLSLIYSDISQAQEKMGKVQS